MRTTDEILCLIQDFYKANLPAEIDAQNKLAKDSLMVPVPEHDAYGIQFITEKMLVFNPWILIGEEDIGFEQVAHIVKEFPKIRILIGMSPNAAEDDENLPKILFRFRKALINVLANNFRRVIPGMDFKIQIDPPAPFNVKGQDFGVVGILIEPIKGV